MAASSNQTQPPGTAETSPAESNSQSSPAEAGAIGCADRNGEHSQGDQPIANGNILAILGEKPSPLAGDCHTVTKTVQETVADGDLPAFVTAPSLLAEKLLTKEVFLSPGFRSVAAVAGWDDESLLMATQEEGSYLSRTTDGEEEPSLSCPNARSPVAVEGSPQQAECRGVARDRKREERTPQQAATPLSAGRRHRRARRQTIHGCSPEVLPIGDLSLNEEFQRGMACQRDQSGARPQPSEGCSTVPAEAASTSQAPVEEINALPNADDRVAKASTEAVSTTTPEIKGDAKKPACLDQLREELSCAVKASRSWGGGLRHGKALRRLMRWPQVCLEICFEPSTTSCGHSFCRGCLQAVLQKCGPRCPKCRQQLKGDTWRSCPVNVVLWNTVQILFPGEMEGRRGRSAGAAPPTPAAETAEEGLVAEGEGRPAAARGWQTARARAAGLRRAAAAHSLRRASREEEERGRVPPASSSSSSSRRRRQEQLDAALARRLQQAEMMQSAARDALPTTIASAAANLRAVAYSTVRHRLYH